MTAEYESTNVPGLYFAGTLSHGKDFKRASGGFIHGFRYNVRVLARTLEMHNHGVLWPHEVVPIPSGAASAEAAYRSLSISVLKRCSDTSALYQMFKRLFDLFEKPKTIDDLDTPNIDERYSPIGSELTKIREMQKVNIFHS